MFIFRIKEIREEKGISITKLSELTNLSQGYLTDLENSEKTNPTLDVLYNISIALGVNIKELFYTRLDIDYLKEKLNTSIDTFGINNEETLKVSQLLDLLINIEIKQNLDKN